MTTSSTAPSDPVPIHTRPYTYTCIRRPFRYTRRYIHIYIYIYIHLFIYTDIDLSFIICTYVSAHIHVYMNKQNMNIHILYIYMYAYIYICIQVHIDRKRQKVTATHMNGTAYEMALHFRGPHQSINAIVCWHAWQLAFGWPRPC